MKDSNLPKEKQDVLHRWDEVTALKYADEYGEHPINQMTARRAGLVNGDRILDVGCGTGSALRAAVELVDANEVVGIDPTAPMIHRAREISERDMKNDVISFMYGCAEKIPLQDDQITISWAINSMHHWRDVQQGLAEVKRVLIPEGRLLIIEEIFEHRIGMQLSDVRNHLTQAGFEITKEELWNMPDCDMNVAVAINKKGN